MKVKLLTEEAAAKFSKKVGECVDLQTPDALALIADKGAEEVAEETVPTGAAPFDGDGDGRVGGSKPKKAKAPKTAEDPEA